MKKAKVIVLALMLNLLGTVSETLFSTHSTSNAAYAQSTIDPSHGFILVLCH